LATTRRNPLTSKYIQPTSTQGKTMHIAYENRGRCSSQRMHACYSFCFYQTYAVCIFSFSILPS